MGVESDADRLVFLDVDEFGTNAIVNGRQVRGIFFDGTEEVAAPFGGELIDNRPQLIARSADVDASGVNTDTDSSVTIGTTTYAVRELKPDGTGITVIELHEA